MRSLSLVVLFGSAVTGSAQNQPGSDRQKVHDPSTVMVENGTPFCLVTGMGIQIFKRDQNKTWTPAGSIFPRGDYPAWHQKEVPRNRGHLWAPDLIKVGEKWLVYYSVSSFGKNHSAIGLVTGTTLDPDSENFKWKDEGAVITSRAENRFNAIDPALIMVDGKLWMSFGSFWDGIMLVELDPATGLMKHPQKKPIQLAYSAEIEAPFICKQNGWFYLFVNWGKCCRGVESTYEIRIGRSRRIDGIYLDKEGTKMQQGGGSLLIESTGKFIGPGHASIFLENGKQWLVHHFYDGGDRGRSKLRMLEILWKDGWPVIAGDTTNE